MTVASLSLTRGRDHLELAVDGKKARVPFAQADVDTLTAIIADYQAAVVDDLAAELPVIGRRLFAWLDSKGGWITGLLEGFSAPLRLEIMSPGRPKPEHRALLEAPWELLFEDGFLAGDATTRYTPVRLIGERGQPRGPRPGALSVLFMAAAPRGEMELAFEEEEARILARTADMARWPRPRPTSIVSSSSTRGPRGSKRGPSSTAVWRTSWRRGASSTRPCASAGRNNSPSTNGSATSASGR